MRSENDVKRTFLFNQTHYPKKVKYVKTSLYPYKITIKWVFSPIWGVNLHINCWCCIVIVRILLLQHCYFVNTRIQIFAHTFLQYIRNGVAFTVVIQFYSFCCHCILQHDFNCMLWHDNMCKMNERETERECVCISVCGYGCVMYSKPYNQPTNPPKPTNK